MLLEYLYIVGDVSSIQLNLNLCKLHGIITLYNLLRTRIPQMHLSEVDYENEYGNIIPGVSRETVQLTDPNTVRGQCITVEGNLLRNYLKDYYNSDLGLIFWQDNVCTYIDWK